MTARLNAAACGVFTILVCANAGAQSWHPAKEFSSTSNPNGVWRYGTYAPGTSQSQSGFRLSTKASKNTQGNPMWMATDSSVGTILCRDSDWIWLIPTADGVRPALRFVAPERGNYKITNVFEGGETDSDGHVSIFYHGLSFYLDAFLAGNGLSNRKGYEGTILLEKDEPLDFVVDLGKSQNSKRATTAVWVNIEKYKAPELDPTVPTDKLAAAGVKLLTSLVKEGKLDTKCLRYLAHKGRGLGDKPEMLPSESTRALLDEALSEVKSIELPPSFDGKSFPLQPGDILLIRFIWDAAGEVHIVKSVSADKLTAEMLSYYEAKKELKEVKTWTIRPVVGFYLLRPKSEKFFEILQKRFG